ncbi:hypothetical protein AAEP80_01700 [Curtobacterium sp. L3-7]|uniref:hypothetical protein n=1 Tax=Curtobacterium sp. L3-7 TaxID=3138787 RepID=UPI003B515BCC
MTEADRAWAQFFAEDRRFEVTSDAVAYARIRRNTTLSVLAAVIAGGVLAGLAFWTGRPVAIVLASMMIVARIVFVVVVLRKAPALLRQQAGRPAASYSVGNDGVGLPFVHLSWSSIRGVFQVDETEAVARSRRRPGIPGLAARWSAHNGRATKHLVFVVEDGTALRRRVDRRSRGIVKTWPGGTEPSFGTIWLDLDPVLADQDVERLGTAASVQASRRGIATTWSRGSADYTEYMGRLSGVFDGLERPAVPPRSVGNPFVGEHER